MLDGRIRAIDLQTSRIQMKVVILNFVCGKEKPFVYETRQTIPRLLNHIYSKEASILQM